MAKTFKRNQTYQKNEKNAEFHKKHKNEAISRIVGSLH